MNLQRLYLNSTIIARAPIAFASYRLEDNMRVRSMLTAADLTPMSNGQIPDNETEDDLSARDEASAVMLEYWDKTDDIVTGHDAIKNRGKTYLPAFAEEPGNEYNNRLDAGVFTNVYRDIVESLAGKPFEEEVSLKKIDGKIIPEQIETFIEDVDGAGNNLTSFAGATFFNGINSAIHWIHVDYPKVEPRVRSIAELKSEGIRPFWSHILGRNVLEARCKVIGGKETLVLVRILEPGAPNHIRVFERSNDGVVMFGLFREKIDGLKKTFVLIDSGPITIGVIPLVPFYTGRRDGRSYRMFPVMRDAADLQIHLYRQESALNFSKIMGAYAMLAANGIKLPMEADNKTPKRIAVGPNKVLVSPPDGMGNSGSWSYVQPSAEIMKFLADHIKATMDQLRELGRQPLTAQSGNLTVITTAYAAGKAKSAVGAWGLRLKDALENALVLTSMWLDIKRDTYDPEIVIYDEYDDFNTDQAADLGALATMRAAKDLSRPAYIVEMKRRNVLIADFDAEKDALELLKETPSDTDIIDDDGAGNSPQPTPLKAVK